MTNPYGTDPGSPPQGLGAPPSQGPQFVAPGAQGPYGPPPYGPPQGQPSQPYGPPQGPPAQRPYGQPGPYVAPGGYPPPQPPYAQGGNPYGHGPRPYSPAPQPPRRRSSSTVVVVVVLVALVLGIGVGAYQLYRATAMTPVTQATPTRTTRTSAAPQSGTMRPTPSSRVSAANSDCVSGDRIATSDFVATVPTNWTCDGDDGDVSISSTSNDALWVDHADGTSDLAADCRSQIEDLGIVGELPQESWGGKTAVAFRAVDSGDIFGIRCVAIGDQTWYLMYFPLDPKNDSSVRTAVTTMMRTWVWK